MACEDIMRVDGIEPKCASAGCPVPRLDSRAARLMEIRQQIIALGSLMSPADAIRTLGAHADDVLMLAEADVALKEDMDA